MSAQDLDQIVDDAPTLTLRSNEGKPVVERQVLVGYVKAGAEAKGQLEAYCVCMDYAVYDSRERQWKQCLFSEGAADTLKELRAEGQFPYSFEAVPSQAEAEWQLAKVSGASERPLQPLRAYVTPASLEALAKLAAIHKEE